RGGGGANKRPGRPAAGSRRTRGDRGDADFDTLPEELEQEFSFLYSRQVGEKIYAMSFDDGQIYAGKIIKRSLKYTGRKGARGSQSLMRNPPVPHYLAHYKGWSSRYEEWVQETQILTDEQVRKSGKVRIGPDRGDESTSSSDSQDTADRDRCRHRSAEKKKSKKVGMREEEKGELGVEAEETKELGLGNEDNSELDEHAEGKSKSKSTMHKEDGWKRSTESRKMLSQDGEMQPGESDGGVHESIAIDKQTSGARNDKREHGSESDTATEKSSHIQSNPEHAPSTGAETDAHDMTGPGIGSATSSARIRNKNDIQVSAGERGHSKESNASVARKRGGSEVALGKSAAEEMKRKRRKRVISSTSEDSSEAEDRKAAPAVEKKVSKSSRDKQGDAQRDSREKSVIHREPSQDTLMTGSEAEARAEARRGKSGHEKRISDKNGDRKCASRERVLENVNSRKNPSLGPDGKENEDTKDRVKRETSRGRESERERDANTPAHRERKVKGVLKISHEERARSRLSGTDGENGRDTDRERDSSRDRGSEKLRQKIKRRKEREKERARRNSDPHNSSSVPAGKSSTLIVRLPTSSGDPERATCDTLPESSAKARDKSTAVEADPKNDIKRPHKSRKGDSPRRIVEKISERVRMKEEDTEEGLEHASDDSLDRALEHAHAAMTKRNLAAETHTTGSKESSSKASRTVSSGLDADTAKKNHRNNVKQKDLARDVDTWATRPVLKHSASADSLDKDRRSRADSKSTDAMDLAPQCTVGVTVGTDKKVKDKRERANSSEKKIGKENRERESGTVKKSRKDKIERDSTSRLHSRPASSMGVKREEKARKDTSHRQSSSTCLESITVHEDTSVHESGVSGKSLPGTSSSRPRSRLEQDARRTGVESDRGSKGADDESVDVKRRIKRTALEKSKGKDTEPQGSKDRERSWSRDIERTASRDKGRGSGTRQGSSGSSKSGGSVGVSARKGEERNGPEARNASSLDLKHEESEVGDAGSSPRKLKLVRGKEKRVRPKGKDTEKHRGRSKERDRVPNKGPEYNTQEYKTPASHEDGGSNGAHGATIKNKKQSGGEKSRRSRSREKERDRGKEREREKARATHSDDMSLGTNGIRTEARSRSLSAHSSRRGSGGVGNGTGNHTSVEGSNADEEVSVVPRDGVVSEPLGSGVDIGVGVYGNDTDIRSNTKQDRDKRRKADVPVSDQKPENGRGNTEIKGAADETTPSLKTPKSTEDVLTETSKKLLNYARLPSEDNNVLNGLSLNQKQSTVTDTSGKRVSTNAVPNATLYPSLSIKARTQPVQKSQIRSEPEADTDVQNHVSTKADVPVGLNSPSGIVPDIRKQNESKERLSSAIKLKATAADNSTVGERGSMDKGVLQQLTSNDAKREGMEVGIEASHRLKDAPVDNNVVGKQSLGASVTSTHAEDIQESKGRSAPTHEQQPGLSDIDPCASETRRRGVDGKSNVSVTVAISREEMAGQTRPCQPVHGDTTQQKNSDVPQSLSLSTSGDAAGVSRKLNAQAQLRDTSPQVSVSATYDSVSISRQKALDEFSVKHILAQSARERSARARPNPHHSPVKVHAYMSSRPDSRSANTDHKDELKVTEGIGGKPPGRVTGATHSDSTHTAPAAPTPTQVYNVKEFNRSSSDGAAENAQLSVDTATKVPAERSTNMNANMSGEAIPGNTLPKNRYPSTHPRAATSIGGQSANTTARAGGGGGSVTYPCIPAHMYAIQKKAEADNNRHGTQASHSATFPNTARPQQQPIPRPFSPVPGGACLLPNILPPKKRMFYSSGDHTPDYNPAKTQRAASPTLAPGDKTAPKNMPQSKLSRTRPALETIVRASDSVPTSASAEANSHSQANTHVNANAKTERDERLSVGPESTIGAESGIGEANVNDAALGAKRPMGSRLTMMLAPSWSDNGPA
ncbi:hypothetical protein SARC_08199, partial [Sphaeroforma arctica JP610]